MWTTLDILYYMLCTVVLFILGSCRSRGISLNAPHQTGTFCGRSPVRRLVVMPVSGGQDLSDVFCPHVERDETSRNRLRRSSSLHALRPYAAQTRVWMVCAPV